MKGAGFITTDEVLKIQNENFLVLALKIFDFQYQNNPLYHQFSAGKVTPQNLTDIPFLPISFFKSHEVLTGNRPVERVFTSSGTTGMAISKHMVCDLNLYERSFDACFQQFYGSPKKYAVLCLLPAYMEREGSSLIYMAEKLVEASQNPDSGFFLKSEGALIEILGKREASGDKSLLLGVSFALLDFAEGNPMPLQHTIMMETGGMKGRRVEMTRMELHAMLKKAFRLNAIHSEYGMTELMSQAYSMGEGRYRCPPWMRVLVRDEDDPFSVKETGAGILCIIDLANLYSCAFIETADVGRVYPDGSFEVLGRIDNSDIRGCSLLVV
jgi:hypothetical protein